MKPFIVKLATSSTWAGTKFINPYNPRADMAVFSELQFATEFLQSIETLSSYLAPSGAQGITMCVRSFVRS